MNQYIVLGVSGSIAAYKALYLLRLYLDAGAQVHPVLTTSATRFVGPLSFSALSGHRAITNLWSPAEAGEMGHVESAHKANVVVIAPTTADLLARIAQGRANDPLTAIALATQAPLVIAPAMEDGMWRSAATRRNVRTLEETGARIVGPDSGALGSGRQGIGRMAEPEAILEATIQTITPSDLAGRTLLITAGPTREHIDPARFLSNPSTGKMGYAIARAARRRGAHVILITGPTHLNPPPGIELVPVTTTEELFTACERYLPKTDGLIMAAAPADYRPTNRSPTKIKKTKQAEAMSLKLKPTPDILGTLNARTPNRIVVGFAAETDHLAKHASEKLKHKNLDLIVANDITDPNAGFAVDTNTATFINRQGTATTTSNISKDELANQLLDQVAALGEKRWPTD